MATAKATFADKSFVIGRAARVGAGLLTDRIVPRKAIHATDVPASVTQITPEWLTAVLCKDKPGAKVLGVTITGGSAGTSTRAGLALTLNTEAQQLGVPTRLFTKSSPTFAQRMFLGLTGAMIGESGFYNQIRPLVDIEAPRGYYCCMDPVSWRSMIMMEDIAVTKDAKFISTETYIDRQKIESLLANMAKWHGHFWADPQLNNALSWLRTPEFFLTELGKYVDMKGRSMVAMEKYPHLVPPDILHRGDDLWEAAATAFQINSTMPQTFLHGDCHIGQTYLTRDGNVGYSDWQVVMRGGWAFDYTYALTSALTIEDRRNWEQDLLRYYLDRLHASGGPTLDFDHAWLHYRQHTFYPFFAWALTRVGAGAIQPEFQADYVCNDIMTRTAHAVSDLESLKAVAQR